MGSRSANANPIDVREHGSTHSGVPLVVLHGGPGAPGSARGLALLLAQRYPVLEPLQRRSGDVPLGVEQHVEDLAGVAPERASLIGHSWGAMLALSYAALHPERVRALVLVGCGTYDDAAREAYHQAFARRLTPDLAARRARLRQNLEQAISQLERDQIRAELAALAAEVMSYAALPEPGTYDRIDARGLTETWDDVLRLQREGIEPARFAAIRTPALMLHGDDDPHPGALTWETLRPHMPQLEYVGLPRCGHEPWHERYARDLFSRTLFDWLARISSS
jgi:pimeloyl-ACP methyl ester carboxylesterase